MVRNKFIMCVAYRAPNSSIIFLVKIDVANIADIMIIGDFNADPQTQEGRKLSLFAKSNILTLHITEPTRISQASATVLDQCLSNFPQCVQHPRVQQPVFINDHCTIRMYLLFRHKKSKCYKCTMWQFNQCDLNQLQQDILRLILTNIMRQGIQKLYLKTGLCIL